MFAEILEERRTQKLERYTRHREVDDESERDRARIEVDAGADTKTTTKMWKRKNKGKKKQVTIETHTWLRGPRGWGFSHGLDPPPTPNLSGRISNHPMQGSKCLHGKGCQKRVVRASLNFWLRPFFPAVLACGFPSGIIR